LLKNIEVTNLFNNLIFRNLIYYRRLRPDTHRLGMSDRELKIWVDTSGNKRVCTELFKKGEIDRARYIADVTFCRQSLPESVMQGYRIWGPACASLMRRYPLFMKIVSLPTKWFIENSAFHMSLRDSPHWCGQIVRNFIFIPFCWVAWVLARVKSAWHTT
jgi:hypothetical protein